MSNPPIYAAVVSHMHGFDPERLPPTPTAGDLIAQSYADLRRRHAKDRARDAHGRFLPAPAWRDSVVSGEVVRVIES